MAFRKYCLILIVYGQLLFLTGCVALLPLLDESPSDAENSRIIYSSSTYRSSAVPRQRSASTESKVTKLIGQMKSPDPVIRVHAAYWLGEMGPGAQPAVPILINNLQNSHQMVRRASAKALGKIGDKRAIEPVRVLTKDKDRYVADSAAKVVRRLEAVNRQKSVYVRKS